MSPEAGRNLERNTIMEKRVRTGGVEDACRDRWQSLETTIYYIQLGRKDLDKYLAGLLKELASYYEAGIMPADVKTEYERKIHCA